MNLFKSVFFALIFLNSYFLHAQNKTPEASLVKVLHFKIDGELDEWNNKLPNFNKSTSLFYAISNDDKNLYLSIQAEDVVAIQKIISNGLSLSLFGLKKDESAVITFPIMHNKGSSINNHVKRKVNATNTNTVDSQLDSLSKIMNKQLIEYSKEIKVIGINSVADTFISIYNENNIKAALRFTNKRVLNYELSLPIAYIQPKLNKQNEINFNIKLNGSSNGSKTELSADGKAVVISGNGGMRMELAATSQTLDLISINNPTDFSGKYTIPKLTK